MLAYLLRRMLWMVPTFLGILIINFAVLRMQDVSLAETLVGGGEAGERQADGKQMAAQVQGHLVKLRRTGRDLPALLNTRGFIGPEGIVERLRAAERVGTTKDSDAFRAEVELWSGGSLLVEPLAGVLRDPAQARYHGPAATALTYAMMPIVLPETAERQGVAWVEAARTRIQELERLRVGYRNERGTGFATTDPKVADKVARLLVLVDASPGEWDRSTRRWTALVGETGFTDFFAKLLTGTLYSETRKQPVWDLIAERWQISFTYNFIAIAIGWIGAVLIGIRSARRMNTFEDKATTQVLFLTWSLPSFFVGTLFLHLLCTDHPGGRTAWFPNRGILSPDHAWMSTWEWLKDAAWHATLPLIVLCYGSFTSLSRYMRGSLLDQLGSDYARTARAKGVDEDGVVYRHTVPNSMITMITLGSGLLASLFGGSVIVEQIFSIPGLGQLLLDAAIQRDAPLVMGSTIISVGLLLIGILIADILYAVVDPRVRARYA